MSQDELGSGLTATITMIARVGVSWKFFRTGMKISVRSSTLSLDFCWRRRMACSRYLAESAMENILYVTEKC